MLREPDQYAETIAAPATAAGAMLPTEIHSASTKILPGATIQEGGRQTDVKTEVMPAYLSQVTDVKAPAKATGAGRSRRFGLIGAGVAAVVLACTAVGGAYLYNPALFDHAEQTPSASLPTVEDVPAPPVESNATDASASAVATAENNSAAAPSNSSLERPRESAKTSRSQSGAKEQPQTESRGVSVEGETVYAGNTRISNGRVQTPNVVVDPNGMIPRPGVNVPTIPPPDLRHLTPEQRRRVMRAIRRNGVVIARPSPE
jgi:hypothetical protein